MFLLLLFIYCFKGAVFTRLLCGARPFHVQAEFNVRVLVLVLLFDVALISLFFLLLFSFSFFLGLSFVSSLSFLVLSSCSLILLSLSHSLLSLFFSFSLGLLFVLPFFHLLYCPIFSSFSMFSHFEPPSSTITPLPFVVPFRISSVSPVRCRVFYAVFPACGKGVKKGR